MKCDHEDCNGAHVDERKVIDMAKRMLKMTTASRSTIAEAATAHTHCLASLALEATEGDRVKAEALLRTTFEDVIESLATRELVHVIENGRTIKPRKLQ